MRCPYCGNLTHKVIDTREANDGEAIRRRRECLQCHRRFTTYETVESIPYYVIKRNGQREIFSRQKVLAGLLKACEKRQVPLRELEKIVEEVEQKLMDKKDREIRTEEIGAHVMDRLKSLDQVAYVRFASVYRRFEAIDNFIEEVKLLLKSS